MLNAFHSFPQSRSEIASTSLLFSFSCESPFKPYRITIPSPSSHGFSSNLAGSGSLRQRPWSRNDNLALAVSPKVNNHADNVVDGGIRSLVQQAGGQCGDGEDDEARFNAAVHGCAGDGAQRPFPGEDDQR